MFCPFENIFWPKHACLYALHILLFISHGLLLWATNNLMTELCSSLDHPNLLSFWIGSKQTFLHYYNICNKTNNVEFTFTEKFLKTKKIKIIFHLKKNSPYLWNVTFSISITIKLCRQHGFPWFSLTIHPYHPLPLASFLDCILCLYRTDVNKSLLVSQHWWVHV